MKVFFTLLMLANTGGRESMMTSVPGFYNRADCESAGAAFMVEVKQEWRPRFYCVAMPERNGTR
jgi:hypothetical protein